MTTPEQFNVFDQARGRAAQRYAAATMEGAQRVLRVQMEAGRDVLGRNGERWRDALTQIHATQGVPDWSVLMQAQMKLATDMARDAFDGVVRVCEEYARTLEEQTRALSEAYRDASTTGAAATVAPAHRDQSDPHSAEQAQQNDRAAEQVGRQAAEAVSMMTGQPTGSVAAVNTESESQQRRRTLIKP